MNTGNPLVDAIGTLHFEGDVIPDSWYQCPALKFANGKPNTVAILLLANIVYWYRPATIRDEHTDLVIAQTTKFRGKKLQKSYEEWGKKWGFKKRQIKDAVLFLMRAGLITREISTMDLDNGVTLGNVVFIEPCLEQIMDITYDLRDPMTTKRQRGIRASSKGATLERQRGITPAPPSRQSNGRAPAPKRQTSTKSTPQSNSQTTTSNGVVVDESILNDLIAAGVTKSTATDFAASAPDESRRQLEYLPHRKGRTDKAATLVKAIREHWAAPDEWQASQAAAEADRRSQQDIQRREQERVQESEQQRAIRDANAELDQMFAKLDAANRARIDAEAIERLGVLGRIGQNEAALQAMRRTLLRERLGQLVQEGSGDPVDTQPVEEIPAGRPDVALEPVATAKHVSDAVASQTRRRKKPAPSVDQTAMEL